MSNQQQSHYQRQHHQQSQDHRQSPRTPQEQRREFLWRERVKLELQVQAHIARIESLSHEWQRLQDRKAAIQQQRPKLAAQIMLSGLAGNRYLPAERLHLYERERIMQEEERLQQEALRWKSDLAAIQAQIEVITLELSFLS